MRIAGWLVLIVVLAAPASATEVAALQGGVRVNPTAAAVQAFQKTVAEYVKVRDEAASGVPAVSETDDPKKIADRQSALAEAIRAARTGAKPGDVFCEEFRPVLLQAIRDDFASRSATDRKALVEELPTTFRLSVNMTYPPTWPLVTVPAKLLRALPDLPPELEYRIVGRHLILRDTKANIVVDFVRDAVPTIPS